MPKVRFKHSEKPPHEAEPFLFEGGPVGCLLIHGYTGSPKEMRPLGRHLNERGITVSGIRLRGHGTSPEDMEKTGWRDWADSAIEGYLELKKRCEKVFIAGFSLGGTLSLYLGGTQKDAAGIICLAAAVTIRDWRLPFLYIGKKFIRFFPKEATNDLHNQDAINDMWGYNKHPLRCAAEVIDLTGVVRDLLPHVTAPLLILHGMGDRSLTVDNADYILKNAASADKERHFLKLSGHGLVVDAERNEVFTRTHEFIKRNSNE